MKTEQEIEVARNKLATLYMQPGLSQVQKGILSGMISAMCWAADAPNASTMQDLLDGRAIITPNVN